MYVLMGVILVVKQQEVNDKIIFVMIEVFKGGFVVGDMVLVWIFIWYNKYMKSMSGIIVMLF